jgi:hypothetical protein
MSYIPTPQKMDSLGFDNKFQLGPRIFLASLNDGGYVKVVLPLPNSERTRLIVANQDEEITRMSFMLPSEQFFDQLLVAVDAKIRPKEPKPASSTFIQLIKPQP